MSTMTSFTVQRGCGRKKKRAARKPRDASWFSYTQSQWLFDCSICFGFRTSDRPRPY